METISIFMTKYDDILSKFIYYISGCGYTHAAVCFDSELQEYYTFNYKGFRREHPFGGRRRYGKSICYKLEVTKEQHARLKWLIKKMEQKNVDWKYSLIGVVLCILGIKHKFQNYYFCSQFVAELLEKSEIILWKKHSSLYLPNHLCREIDRHAGLIETVRYQCIEKNAENVI